MSGPGLLSVVATPIGNLEDISLRALRVLRAATLILAEDTRRTAKLLSHHGIQTPCQSFHAHNAHRRIPGLLARLASGEHLALVTDAGTPGISDPGVELVQACRTASVLVEVIPGASAPLTAAVASGFPLVPLTILGFPPVRSKDRDKWMKEVANIHHTLTFFEAPHRILVTAHEVGLYFGDRPICLVREATKLHEEHLFFRSNNISTAAIRARGEFTVVVGPKTSDPEHPQGVSDDQVVTEFRRRTLADPKKTRKTVLDEVAAALGLSRNAVYRSVERGKRAGLEE